MSILCNETQDKSTEANADFVTIITVDGRANKLVTRSKDGKVSKDAGPPISSAIARTFHVKNCKAMARLQRKIGKKSNQVLSLGFVPGTEPKGCELAGEPYNIVSQKIMGEAIGADSNTPEGRDAILGWHEIGGKQCICRLKANMAPSTWCLFDIDAVRGMPDHLTNMDSNKRRTALAEVISGFAEAGIVVVPSTTGRVLIDGKPMDATGEHFYIQLRDAADLERFGAVLLQRSLLSNYGFMRPRYSRSEPDKVVARIPWGIADPTTFSHERLVYDGAPEVRGEGLKVSTAVIEEIKGGRLDTSKLLDLSDEEVAIYAKMTGQNVLKEHRTETVMGADGKLISRKVFRFGAVDERLLKMDTSIETEAGTMTLVEYWKSAHVKLRCQTPFRDSGSWNGILGFHSDGVPFVFDNGIRTKYILPKEVVDREHAKAWVSRLRQMSAEDSSHRWTEHLRNMSPTSQEYVRQDVHRLTGIDLRVLKEELNAANDTWEREKLEAKNIKIIAKATHEGLVRVHYKPPQMKSMINDVEKAIFENPRHDPVMGYGQALVSVIQSHPQTVREVEALGKETYPLMPIIKAHRQDGLALRISEDIFFFVYDFGKIKQIAPPPLLLRTMLEVSPERAPGLVGVLEHPAMNANGEVICGQGYDRETGFFKRIPDELVPNLPDNITQKDAAQELKWIVNNVCADFPFATDIDLAGFLSLLLTAIQRRLLSGDEGCPGGGISAPVQASGKTALTQVLFQLVLGRSAAATTWVQDDVEMAKHLLAVLLEGHPAVLFDNLPEGGVIESNELAKAMTSATYSGRVLGENRKAVAPTNVLWLFTGNNVTPTGDFNTRVLLIYLDPNCESPENRKFSRPDLAGWCANNRARFFEAAITILVGYYKARAAGKGVKIKPTRYRDWDMMIREALIWAGAADPAELFDKNKTEDPVVEGRRNLLAAWHEQFGDKPVTVANVIKRTSGGDNLFPSEDPLAKLKNAISDLLPHGRVTSKALGTTISKFKGRWLDGFQLQAVGAQNGTKLWRVMSR